MLQKWCVCREGARSTPLTALISQTCKGTGHRPLSLVGQQIPSRSRQRQLCPEQRNVADVQASYPVDSSFIAAPSISATSSVFPNAQLPPPPKASRQVPASTPCETCNDTGVTTTGCGCARVTRQNPNGHGKVTCRRCLGQGVRDVTWLVRSLA